LNAPVPRTCRSDAPEPYRTPLNLQLVQLPLPAAPMPGIITRPF
jgi:hypothetical protein